MWTVALAPSIAPFSSLMKASWMGLVLAVKPCLGTRRVVTNHLEHHFVVSSLQKLKRVSEGWI